MWMREVDCAGPSVFFVDQMPLVHYVLDAATLR